MTKSRTVRDIEREHRAKTVAKVPVDLKKARGERKVRDSYLQSVQGSLFTPSGLEICYEDLVTELTNPVTLADRNPVSTWRLRKILESKFAAPPDVDTALENVNKEFLSIMAKTVRKDTVCVLPFYYFNESYGDTIPKKYDSMARDLICCLRNREGERPRILTAKFDLGSAVTMEGPVRDSETGLFSAPVTGAPSTVECMSMKTEDYASLRKSIVRWLKSNPEVKNLIFQDTSSTRAIFPEFSSVPTSLKAGSYRVFEEELYDPVTSERRKFKVCYIPTYVNHHRYGDRTYDISADMMSILMNPGTIPTIRKTEIFTVKEAKDILRKVMSGAKELSLDIETTGLNPVYPEQAIISASVSDGNTSWGFFVNHPQIDRDGFSILEVFMDEPELTMILQNAVFDFTWYKHLSGKYPACKMLDTMLLDHWLFESQGSVSKYLQLGFGYGMDTQIPRYLRVTSHKPMLTKAIAEAKVRNPYKMPSGNMLRRMTLKDLESLIQERMSEDWLEPNSGAYAAIDPELLLDYNMEDAAYTMLIYKRQKEMINEQCGEKWPMVITQLMPDLVSNCVDMNLKGAPLDYDSIIDKARVAFLRLQRYKSELSSGDLEDINIDSPAQMIELLIKKGIPTDELMDFETEKLSADQDTLIKFKDRLEWIPKYLTYKKLHKFLHTYLIPMVVYSYKGVLYFDMSLTGTSTGRLSSRKPNIQNLPRAFRVDTFKEREFEPTGKERVGLKEVIRTMDGHMLADMDLSSAEVKVLTAVCPDPELIKVLKEGLDAHCYTAHLISKSSGDFQTYEEMYASHMKKEGKNLEPMTEQDEKNIMARQNAKRVTFGSIYRAGKRGLSKQLDIIFTPELVNGQQPTIRQVAEQRQLAGEKEAESLLKTLFQDVYPMLGQVFETSDIKVFEDGYSESLFGRRRRFNMTDIPMVRDILLSTGFASRLKNPRNVDLTIEDCKAFIPSKRSFRQSLNFQVQSPTSDYMQFYIAFIRRKIKEKGLNIDFHLTVHDSAVFRYENIPGMYEAFIDICDEGMNVYLMSLSDKLPVTIGYGIDVHQSYCPVGS